MKISIKDGKVVVDGELSTFINPKEGEQWLTIEDNDTELIPVITGMIVTFPEERKKFRYLLKRVKEWFNT